MCISNCMPCMQYIFLFIIINGEQKQNIYIINTKRPIHVIQLPYFPSCFNSSFRPRFLLFFCFFCFLSAFFSFLLLSLLSQSSSLFSAMLSPDSPLCSTVLLLSPSDVCFLLVYSVLSSILQLSFSSFLNYLLLCFPAFSYFSTVSFSTFSNLQ